MLKSTHVSWIALFALLGLSTTASAEPWEGYKTAFPAFPCQDGWMGCIEQGKHLGPDLQADGTGMPNPADARVGWFDLEATANFSPFPELSRYPGDEPQRKSAVAAPAPATGAAVVDAQDGGSPDDPTGENAEQDDGLAYVSPDVIEAREEADEKRVVELQAKRASENAKAEQVRAKAEADRQAKLAKESADKAAQALVMARSAQTKAEEEQFRKQAARAAEQAKTQEAKAAEAKRLQQQRDKEAAQRADEERRAKIQREKAEADRQKKEAADRAAAEKARKEEAERKRAADAVANKKAEEARKKAQAIAAKQADAAAKRAKELADQARAAASDAERKELEAKAKKAAEDQKKAQQDAARKADQAAEKARLEEQQKAKALEDKRKADEKAKRDAEMQKMRDDKAAKEVAANDASASSAMVGSGGCDNLVELETVAILGKLNTGTIQCLEDRLGTASRQTEKSKISRTLMINAFLGGKTNEWAKLMKRHLNEIEQSDPELCYKYALHLSKKGPVSAYQVIKWSNVALENRTIWTGSTYTSRVYSLYKIRAKAAEKIWIDLENKHSSKPTEESSQKTKTGRDRTKEYAREWYEYAKVAGKPTEKALDLCMSSAGTKDYCEAG